MHTHTKKEKEEAAQMLSAYHFEVASFDILAYFDVVMNIDMLT